MPVGAMKSIHSLKDVKERLQAGFDNKEDSIQDSGERNGTQLKAYLIENNNVAPLEVGSPKGEWRELEDKRWFVNIDKDYPESFYLDTTRSRVWILYSIIDTNHSDIFVKDWVGRGKKLDRCWLSRKQLLHWGNLTNASWVKRGVGLAFSDGLSPDEDAANFSLKAWHGKKKLPAGLDKVLATAQKEFAIHSIRWQKRSNSSVDMSTEWYSNGKVTINRATDVDDVFIWVTEMANYYSNALKNATTLRDTTFAAFELDFSQEINLNAFTSKVLNGAGDMKLWLTETERQKDFARYKGVDLHTWDRVFIDVGVNYAYLTIPKGGCVNAAPRIATIQGEDNAGYTKIFHEGVEVFA
jgi:hypothetical protein